YGGYSYYTTCMLDTNSIGRIMYQDAYPALPDGDNVRALLIDGQGVDFSDTSTYYRVSTVNYLAAGSCNFNDGGTSLWPLDQIVNDTQYYVRDAVIDYITAQGTVSPKIEGRLLFGDADAPVITIAEPTASTYQHSELVTLDFSAVDAVSGVGALEASLDGKPVTNGQTVDLHTLALGNHTLVVTATDWYGNSATQSVDFTVTTSIASLKDSVIRLYDEGKIKKAALKNVLLWQLDHAQALLDAGKKKAAAAVLSAFILTVKAQSHKAIEHGAAALLIADAKWVIRNL
ncbi:MAG TPA: hypothetical protein VF382_07895, partial [Actinomycetota bacterium]